MEAKKTNLKEKIKLFTELQEVKNNVLSCLKDDSVSIDFQGLSYWAEQVEKLREKVKEYL